MTVRDYTRENGLGEPIDWRRLAEASMDETTDYLISFNSYERTAAMALLMSVIANDRPEHCIRIFLNFALMCDAPWNHRSVIADALRRARTQVDWPDLLEPDERAFYAALPDLVSVWRGCEECRERGISWTLDRAVAEGFAQGKRCRNRFPTLARAQIPKPHIFGSFSVAKKKNRRLPSIHSGCVS
jgi:hypothetical protein